MIAAAAADETRRLKRLTESGEPKTADRIAAVRERLLAIEAHALERCAFYDNGDTPSETADAWSEVANEAHYRADKIADETWGWA